MFYHRQRKNVVSYSPTTFYSILKVVPPGIELCDQVSVSLWIVFRPKGLSPAVAPPKNRTTLQGFTGSISYYDAKITFYFEKQADVRRFCSTSKRNRISAKDCVIESWKFGNAGYESHLQFTDSFDLVKDWSEIFPTLSAYLNFVM